MSMEELSRSSLRALLQRWAANEITAVDVHERAEALWESQTWPPYSHDDDRSIAVEVLSQLDIIDHQLITVDDVPAIVRFLDTPPGRALEGWVQWVKYWEGVDMKRRMLDLAANPFYAKVGDSKQ